MHTLKLCEAELVALRDYARGRLLDLTGERLRWYDPEKNGEAEEVLQAEAHEEMIAAADVVGALQNVELQFSDLGTGRETPEAVDVQFTKRAMVWLEELRHGTRASLDDGRGTIEINSERGPQDSFLLFVLDTVAAAAPVVSLDAETRGKLREMVGEELDLLTKGNQIDAEEVGHDPKYWTRWREMAERLALIDDFRSLLAALGWPDGGSADDWTGPMVPPSEGCNLPLSHGSRRVLCFLKGRLEKAVADHDGEGRVEEEHRQDYRDDIAVVDRALGGES